MAEQEQQRVLILVTSGPSTPARCAAPFHTATLLACLDAEVTLYLTGEATELARPGVAEQLFPEANGQPVIHFIRQAKQMGARLLLCRKPPLPGQAKPADQPLIPEVDDYGSGGEMAAMILEYERVLSL
ncbi:DsrE family protein [Marinobacter daepoensis]|uniref:DsrE family protein n=1 Tax=Marinobacter daepoensis TaxID=262077 RepID=A0ABS3BA15_9GAMM|nr:DsrE family protein [Marinobacter daepoensis]MBN7768653.1 DsrE family protein [Marinobacter daepoensis]MBY6032888.1 DsrE family protein [Marinobacter daepoensis]MBY6079390.1 DsrE family protein [Marinobacter daepoensis]